MADARPLPIRYHWLRLRAACHPTEEPGKVREALRFVAGLSEDDFAPAFEDDAMETHHGLPLHIFEVTVDKSRAIRDILQRIFALDGGLETLRRTIAKRIDDDGVFYLRIDKQAAAGGALALLDGEDAVQVRIKLEVYPSTREAALGALEKLLESGRP